MSEYIEREAAIEMIKNDLPEQVRYYRQDAIECLECMPTADVVPKSEYDRLEKLFNDMTQEAKGYLNRLYGIRADVAREIFEDFTKHKVCTNEEDFRVLAQLKKKYTEDENG